MYCVVQPGPSPFRQLKRQTITTLTTPARESYWFKKIIERIVGFTMHMYSLMNRTNITLKNLLIVIYFTLGVTEDYRN